MTINVHSLNAPGGIRPDSKALHLDAINEDESLFAAYAAWERARAALHVHMASHEPGFTGGPADIYQDASDRLTRHAPASQDGMRNILTAAAHILSARQIDRDCIEAEGPALELVLAALNSINYGTGEFTPYWRARE